MLTTFELLKQVYNHKKRVAAFASKAFGHNSDIAKVMWWHDLEKYILFRQMVLHKDAVSKEEKQSARHFYRALNELGDKIFEFRFGNRSLQEKKHLRNMEKIIDVCDRHLDKVVMKEFKLSERRPLSDFLKPDQMEIAKELLTEYSYIWDEIFDEKFEALV